MSAALRAPGVLVEPPCVEHVATLELPRLPTADEHAAVLGFQLPPFASICLGAEGLLGGEARDLAQSRAPTEYTARPVAAL